MTSSSDFSLIRSSPKIDRPLAGRVDRGKLERELERAEPGAEGAGTSETGTGSCRARNEGGVAGVEGAADAGWKGSGVESGVESEKGSKGSGGGSKGVSSGCGVDAGV